MNDPAWNWHMAHGTGQGRRFEKDARVFCFGETWPVVSLETRGWARRAPWLGPSPSAEESGWAKGRTRISLRASRYLAEYVLLSPTLVLLLFAQSALSKPTEATWAVPDGRKRPPIPELPLKAR